MTEPNQDSPKSLLNSRRMYLKVLQALDAMDAANQDGGEGQAEPDSPNVDELDLFITTTDIEGVLIPLKLADTVVYERRHRSVYRLKYDSKQRNDNQPLNHFKKKYNPFLAFAARCTSSFPFAFEPMSLTDIDEAVETFMGYEESGSDTWKGFFSEIQLDNKVFDRYSPFF